MIGILRRLFCRHEKVIPVAWTLRKAQCSRCGVLVSLGRWERTDCND